MVDFSHFFKIASKNGLGLRVHAGEFQGAESVIEAIEDLDINRVAHGIRSIEDSKAIALLLERNIALDICYSSNRSFGILGEKYDDSLRELFYKGIALNISSDDPLYFNTTLSNEYNIFKNFLGFSKEELIEINKKAIQHSFASHEDKKILLDILLSNTMVPGL
jgi:adenosine deaminase